MFKKSYYLICLLSLLAINFVFGQERIIKGTVKDKKSGEPLIGVMVTVKPTNKGTSTDLDGNFELIVTPEDKSLVFAFFGMKETEVFITSESNYTVKMEEDISELEQVVVIGYGTKTRAELTEAVSTISSKEIQSMPITGIDQAMQGRAAGVQVTQNSAAPGGGVTVRIRGIGGFGNNNPLYVIDGFPVYSNDNISSASGVSRVNPNVLNTIDPNDIENIEILKDASATAIYGSRGANGVVLITTKHGKKGQANINFDVYYGVQKVWKKLDMLKATEFAQLVNEAKSAAGDQTVEEFKDLNNVQEKYGSGTDWQDQIFRVAPISNYQLSASGGSDNVRYKIAGGYFNQQGTVRNSGFERFSFSTSEDASLSKRIRVGMSIIGSRTSNQILVLDGSNSVITRGVSAFPTTPVEKNEDGTYPRGNTTNSALPAQDHPLATILEPTNNLVAYRAIGNLFTEVNINKYLDLRVMGGANVYTDRFNSFNPTVYPGQTSLNRTARQTSSQEFSWLHGSFLNFRKTIGAHQDISAMVGYELQEIRSERVGASKSDFANNDVIVIDASKALPNDANGFVSESGLTSVFGRVNYTLLNKYSITGTLRRDGSSKFGPGNRHATFPSLSAFWRLSKEGFLQNIPIIHDLKLRGSWGLSGNQAFGSDYPYVGVLDGTFYYYHNNRYLGLAPTRPSNNNLRWETSQMINFGLDFVFLPQQRVDLKVDYFIRKNTDLLTNALLPASSGFEQILVNAGEVENRGIEIALTTRNIVNMNPKGFSWTTDFNFTRIKNKIIQLSRPDEIQLRPAGYSDRTNPFTFNAPNYSIGVYYGYVTDGIFQNWDEVNAGAQSQEAGGFAQPGDIRFKDINNDGKITDADRTVIGSPYPKFFGGLTNRFTYRRFDLTIFANYVYGNDVYNIARVTYEDMTGNNNNMSTVKERWTGPGTSNNMPRATQVDLNNNKRHSDRYIEDGSFLRIKNITVGYTFPDFIKKAYIRNLRVYATVQNLYTLTNYKGFDPEFNSFGQDANAQGFDFGAYPQARVFLIGGNFTF